MILRYPAPMRMHTLPAARLAELLPYSQIAASDQYWGGDHWEHRRHYVVVGAEGQA